MLDLNLSLQSGSLNKTFIVYLWLSELIPLLLVRIITG